jgi:1-acyl-sn-glycerol-3-phosphate acyltransferase
MTTSDTSAHLRIHPAARHQERYTLRRRLLQNYLLRPVGFGLLVKLHVTGLEHVPASGPTIVIMNHIAAIDPFVVVGAVTSRQLIPMTKIENYQHPIVGLMARAWGVYPVRRGEVDRQALDSTIALLEQGRAILIAPEGTRRPNLSEAKGGTTYVATKTGATIVPVGLEGTDQFPASLKRLRRALVTIRIGPAFRFRTEGRARIPRNELHRMTHEMMGQLASLLPERRRGFYSDTSQMPTDYLEFVD